MAGVTFTKEERKAVETAFRDVEYLCSVTNWTDSGAWKEAVRLIRKHDPDATPLERKARIVGAWLDGARAVIADVPITNFPYGHADHYKAAYILGMSHAIERHDNRYYLAAMASAPSGKDSWDAALSRWLDAK